LTSKRFDITDLNFVTRSGSVALRRLSTLLAIMILPFIFFWPIRGVVRGVKLASQSDQSDLPGDSEARHEQDKPSAGKVGFRYRLVRAGITIWASYTADLLGYPLGGPVLAFRYASGLEFGTKFDLKRLLNLKGFLLEVFGDYRSGHDFVRDIGNAFVPAQIFSLERRFGAGTLRLYRFSLEKILVDDCFSLLAGRIGMGDDF